MSENSDNSIKDNLSSTKEEIGKLTLKGLTFNTDVQSALETGKAQGKPIFVYARSVDCGYCKKFEAETFTNKTVIKTLNENFILISIDVYEQRSERINFRVHGTPTSIFLDNNGMELKRIIGYTETQPFLNTINEII